MSSKTCPILFRPHVFSVHEISQERILEWGAMSFSRGSSQSRDQTHVSYIGKRILYTELPPYHPATSLLGIYPKRTKTLTCKDISSVQSLCHAHLFATPWTAAHWISLSITNSWSLLKPMSIESVMPSNHLIVVPFSSCLQSFPASGSFQMSHFFPSGGQNIGVSASASVLPMNAHD